VAQPAPPAGDYARLGRVGCEIPCRAPRSVATLLAEEGSGEPAPEGATGSADLSRTQLRFYESLLRYERAMLQEMRRLIEGRPQAGRRAVERSDVEPMEALIEQLEQRLRFWRQQSSGARSD
jgi:hypothetical protein